MQSVIYAIRNKDSGKAYIGSAVDRCRRWKYHKNRLRLGKHHSQYFQNAWNLHGGDAYEWVVLEDLTEACNGLTKGQVGDLLCYHEDWWTQQQRDGKGSYNLREISKSNLGVKYSDESKRRMGAWQVGKKHSPETIKKLSEARKGKPSPMRGKTFSAEARANMSRAAKGKVFSPEHKAKLVAVLEAHRASKTAAKASLT